MRVKRTEKTQGYEVVGPVGSTLPSSYQTIPFWQDVLFCSGIEGVGVGQNLPVPFCWREMVIEGWELGLLYSTPHPGAELSHTFAM